MKFIKKKLLFFILALNASLMLIDNSTVWANIVVLLDNNISLKIYKQTFHKLIQKAFVIARDVNKEIIFIPICNGAFKYATNTQTAKKIFNFNSEVQFIAQVREEARFDNIIYSGTQSIVIISSMESFFKNKSKSFQFKSQDYKDVLKWYRILSEWLRSSINIHIFLLSENELRQLYSKEVTKEDIEKNLYHLVDLSNNLEILENEMINLAPNRQFTRQSIRSHEFNRNLIYSVLLSLTPVIKNQKTNYSLSGQCYLNQINPKNFDNIIYSLEEIIDPNAVRKLKVKIEIDPNVVDQEVIRNYISVRAISSIPTRHFEYQILNGATESSHDPLFHYHYRIMKVPEKKMVNIVLTNKGINRFGNKFLMNEESRNVLNKSYSDINDLAYIILKELEHLIEYQEIDFPASEKKVMVLLKSDYSFQGYRLIAVPQHQKIISSPTDKKFFSTMIDSEGECVITLLRNTSFKLFLNCYSYKKSILPGKKLTPIGYITDKMIFGQRVISIDTNVLNKLKILNIKTFSNLKGKVIFSPCNYNETGNFNLSTISIPEKKTSIQLYPCRYFYTVLFNYSKNTCLNTWLIPIDLSNENSQIIVNCIDDQLNSSNDPFDIFDEMISEIKNSMDINTVPPVLGKNELTGRFETHLFGSPYFLLRLFQYTSINDPNAQTTEMKELWRRIYDSIFNSSKFPINLIPTIFGPAFNNLSSRYYDRNYKPKFNIKKFLKIILEKYFQDISFVHISLEDQAVYNKEIIEIIQKYPNLNKKFIKKLLIK